MKNFSSILALDTAMNGCSAGVRLADGRTFTETMTMTTGQSEHLVPLVSRVLRQAGLAYSQLDAIIATVGPGAFTGLRIGLSTAKSLGLALDIPVFGITTLQALALQYAQENTPQTQIIVLVDTKREDFYVQIFQADGTAISEPRAIPAGDIELLAFGRAVIFTGDAVERFQGLAQNAEDGWVFDRSLMLPSAGVMAETLAVHGPESPLLFRQINPVYLRAPDVSQPKKPQRVIA